MTISYTHPRTEMLEFFPENVSSVLDVGCSSGAFGEQLRSRFALKHLIGVEPNEEAASQARQTYDSVSVGQFPECADLLPAGLTYGVVVFNDVLEHIIDPAAALEAAKVLLDPGGVVVASIPNIRHVSVLGPLLLKGEFRYRSTGILDNTHVRFFTARSIRRLFVDQGWQIERMEPVTRVLRVGRTETPFWIDLVARMSLGRSDEFLTVQYAVIARPAKG